MTKKVLPYHKRILVTLRKYSDHNKISIKRARYAISLVHRFPRPFNTIIIHELYRSGLIKLNGRKGYIEIIYNQQI